MKTLTISLSTLLVIGNTLSTGVNAALAQDSYVAPTIPYSENTTRCRAGSRVAVNPISMARKTNAEAEWQRFSRQEINHLGAIVQFGGSESENHERESSLGTSVYESPWRNVWRYWSVLYGNSDAAFRSLKITGRSAAPETAPDHPLGGLEQREISEIFRATTFSNEDARLLVEQSLIRSAIVDTPWSAAFISAMHATTGMPSVLSAHDAVGAGTFRMSSGHVDYIKDSYWTSALEQNNQIPVSAAHRYSYDRRFNVYRACDPTTTAPRVGDMYCSIRLSSRENPRNIPLFRLFGEELMSFRPNLSTSHCDIVVEVNRASAKVMVIGGNVNQSVTKRTLNLAGGTFTLNPSRAQVRAASTDETCNQDAQCRINDRPWFVLMQVR